MWMRTTKARLSLTLALLLALFGVVQTAFAQALLPNGMQQFVDANGAPLASGSVSFYVPGTLTPKTTWSDPAGTVPNTNPVSLDAAGRATIYGAGSYRQIVKDVFGATVWDKQTAGINTNTLTWAGTAGGTVNALTVTSSSFTSTDGQDVTFRASGTNTTAVTLNVNTGGALAVVRYLAGGLGSVPLSGGEISAGAIVSARYDAVNGNFQLMSVLNPTNASKTVAAAGTTNLSSGQSQILSITGTGVTISSFGTYPVAWSPLVYVTFAGENTITYNATSMVTPTAQSIVTAAGDTALLVSKGGSNWQVLAYMRAAGNFGTSSLRNLVVKNNVATPNTQIDVTADSATLTTSGLGVYVASISTTINASVVGANGIDTGSIANSTWYGVYLIYNQTTGAVAGLISTSFSSPVVPSGYAYATRVGAMKTDSSSNFYRVLQKGREATYVVTAATNTAAMPAMTNGAAPSGSITTPTWTALSVTAYVPLTATVFRGSVYGVAGTTMMVAPNSAYGAYNSTTNPPQVVLTNSSGRSQFRFELESTNIYYATDSSGTYLFAAGWVDNVPAN